MMDNSEADNKQEAINNCFGHMDIKNSRRIVFKPRHNAAIKAYENIQDQKRLDTECYDELNTQELTNE